MKKEQIKWDIQSALYNSLTMISANMPASVYMPGGYMPK